jgi:hydrogenase maturation protease
MNEWEWQLLEDKERVECVTIAGVEVKTGDRVRLCPHKRGDILDIALRGQIATIESIEQDYEGRYHVCVVVDDDPGRDLGMLRQPGHRFFFETDEVEPLQNDDAKHRNVVQYPRILVAGIGNVFLGDDGFGVEVAQHLATADLPAGVRVVDFGLRGFDLAYALQDGYETTILIDAFPHGQEAGTVSVIEPDLIDLSAAVGDEGFVQTHAMNPMNVLRMAVAMNGQLKRVLLVGCEPATFGPEEGEMGLSYSVRAAVPEAVNIVTRLVRNILNETQSEAAES